MLKNRIISTLHFFDLQDWPLTLLELHRYLLPENRELKFLVDQSGELALSGAKNDSPQVAAGQLLECLDGQCQNEVKISRGFYFLAGRERIAQERWENYLFGLAREKRIKRFAGFLKHLPFIRGAGLSGSQALGQQKAGSDIDLLIITDKRFLWLARTLATFYFQILGMRRHHGKVANRFCLNHYLAGPKTISRLRNLYTALEYGKLRPLVYGQTIREFQNNNFWIKQFFPNWQPVDAAAENQSKAQKILEKLFSGKFGKWLESKLKNWQLSKIRREPFIIVDDDELSFHPDSKQRGILENFFADG